MAITTGAKRNFETLKLAMANNDVAIMEVVDSKTGETVDAICAVSLVNDEYQLAPLAVMVRENPYERFVPPTGG